MLCNINPCEGLGIERTSPNTKVLENIQELPDHVRKQVRLLAKQYFIMEVYIEPSLTYEDATKILPLTAPEYIIKYRNFNDYEELDIFEWKLNIL